MIGWPSPAREVAIRAGVVALLAVLAAGAGPAAALSPPRVGSWLAQARTRIEESEYRAGPVAGTLQAPNRAQGFRTWFEATGVRLTERAGAGRPLLELRLARLGRGDELAAVPPGAVTSDGPRVEIRRPGLLEWYRNGESGLEQGFRVAARPPGRGPLVLELSVAQARASLRGDAVILASASGRRFAYRGLEVRDASGGLFAGRLEVPRPGRVRLSVADGGARYPLTLDPLLSGTADAALLSDQGAARLGYAVARAGDVNGDGYDDLLLGAPDYDVGAADEGAAFLFLGGPGGIADGSVASADARLSSDQAGAHLGWSLASAGDVNGDGYDDVVVGAPDYDGGQLDEGAAFVFLGGAAGLADGTPATAAARLEADQVGAHLGFSVAGAGDVNADGYADLIVGAYRYDAGRNDEGAAFVFLGSAAGVADGTPATAAARFESDQAGASLGGSVASAGDVNGDGYGDVIVGASLYDDGELDEGAAFVFLGGASGPANGTPASAAARLEGDQAAASMGFSVASAGDVDGDGYGDVVVGAFLYDAGQADEGAAFVFLGSAAGIPDGGPATAAARLESDQPGAWLGISVRGIGDVNGDGYADVAAGASQYDQGETDEGAAFVYLGSAAGIAGGPPAAAAARFESDEGGALFGGSVAAGDFDGDGYGDLVVGASAGASGVGAAFLYRGGAAALVGGPPASADTRIQSDQAHAWLGRSIAGAGDVNGDGYGDLIVGAPYYDAGQPSEGAAFVFLGGPGGIPDATPASAATILQSDQGNAHLGYHVAGAGDVNGDGYADVIVGAPLYDDGEKDEGAAFVFLGGPAGIADGTPATAATRLEGNQALGSMGSRIAGAGDVNGDGYADVIVGAPNYDLGQQDSGAAFIFLGSAEGIADGSPATAATRLDSNQVRAFMGGVSSAGDVNGDGYADVIVGVPNYDDGEVDEGLALLFLGSPTGVADGSPATAAARFTSNQPSAFMGSRVSSAGDVNGDGYADVLVTGTGWDGGELDEGGAWVFLGGPGGIPDGTPATAATHLESDQTGAMLGFTAAAGGDVNGDGYGDVVVGAFRYDAPDADEGAVFVFLGGAAGVPDGSPASAIVLEGDQPGALLGYDAGAGDVNGDGYADVFAGAAAYDGPEADEGLAVVFLGNAGAGRAARPLQQRPGDGATVSAWGRSGVGDGFRVELRASHPEGAGRVATEVETCPPGAAFGGPACSASTSAWVSVGGGAPEARIAQDVAGLGANTLYRWRARTLYAPAAGPIPPRPAHGPWRRFGAQTVEADLRTTASDCSDGVDNDGDGLLDDPADPGCTSALDPSEREPGLPCDNGIDDDGDGFADAPADGGCLGPSDPSEDEIGAPCENGLDDDGDGVADFPADLGCTHADDRSEREPGRACDDGVDNDGDGFADFPEDPGCQNAGSPRENPQCQDGVDNDSQAGIDFDGGASANGGVPLGPKDPQCTSAWRDQERGSCGLGFELAPLLVLLSAARRRRRSAR